MTEPSFIPTARSSPFRADEGPDENELVKRKKSQDRFIHRVEAPRAVKSYLAQNSHISMSRAKQVEIIMKEW